MPNFPLAPSKDAKLDLKINTFEERSSSLKTYEEQEKKEGRGSRTDNDLVASKTAAAYGMGSSCTHMQRHDSPGQAELLQLKSKCNLE